MTFKNGKHSTVLYVRDYSHCVSVGGTNENNNQYYWGE